MNLFIICVFVAITAPLAAIALALIKIGIQEIFTYAEYKMNRIGILFILLSWFIFLPIMVLLNLFIGLYKYTVVNFPKHQNHKQGSY